LWHRRPSGAESRGPETTQRWKRFAACSRATARERNARFNAPSAARPTLLGLTLGEARSVRRSAVEASEPTAAGPAGEPFHIEVEPERHAARLALVGELDIGTADELDQRLRELRTVGFRCLVMTGGHESAREPEVHAHGDAGTVLVIEDLKRVGHLRYQRKAHPQARAVDARLGDALVRPADDAQAVLDSEAPGGGDRGRLAKCGPGPRAGNSGVRYVFRPDVTNVLQARPVRGITWLSTLWRVAVSLAFCAEYPAARTDVHSSRAEPSVHR
jgi:hypothetical protein